jgi:hypothetical protein
VEILSEGSTSGPYFLIEVATGGQVRFVTQSGGSAAIVLNPTATNDGLFHHYVASWDGSLLHLYVDGVSVGTPLPIVSGTRATYNTTIGYLPGYGHFGGSIAAARIYKACLNGTQVTANYNAGPNASAGVWGDGVTPGAVLELVAAYGNAFVGG